ncbi:hypothetical protein NEOLI_001791 [Neolecta irregularis DAH-3]|uniref:Flavin reductase like domain-containing protein n=1 Tax=Neolecta irregularis (strain DAH-3) TaxID=1198029 RepID=A0A1U7LH55_NEOID|nr:hypothetical protein NEOLI_001791 [Neolecta irregularis DAH-3]|eukprot:OLL21979.1 hypothetical protein NEOLI_001791 [Neolecta irregularis DAH-3]
MIPRPNFSNAASSYYLHNARRYNSSYNLQDGLRKFMRCVPQPAVIITTCCSENHKIRRGITVSSFNTLSMAEHPLVSFNVQLPSRFAELLRQSSKFIVNFPRACREHAALAHTFSIAGFKIEERIGDLFESAKWSATKFGPLALTDALGRLHCEVVERIPVEDHELIIGRVKSIYDLSEDADEDALIYAHRNYCALGEKL